MGAILGFLVANPMVILGFLGIFVATGVFGEVRGWIRERHAVAVAVKPWAAAVVERDKAAAFKETLVTNAIKDRERTKNEIAALQTQLEASEIQRKAAKAPECNLSADDVRMLNGGRATKKPATR
jgi:hypothetical protein